MSPYGANLYTSGSEGCAVLLLRDEGFEGRPCRALPYLPCLTQGLVALAGLRTLGFEWIAPLGLIRVRTAKEGKDEVGPTAPL